MGHSNGQHRDRSQHFEPWDWRTGAEIIIVYIYRVFDQLLDLGRIDFDHGSSAICPIGLRKMGFWQK